MRAADKEALRRLHVRECLPGKHFQALGLRFGQYQALNWDHNGGLVKLRLIKAAVLQMQDRCERSVSAHSRQKADMRYEYNS